MSAPLNRIYGRSFLDEERIGYRDCSVPDGNMLFRAMAGSGTTTTSSGSGGSYYKTILKPFIQLKAPVVSGTKVTIKFDLYQTPWTNPNTADSTTVVNISDSKILYRKKGDAYWIEYPISLTKVNSSGGSYGWFSDYTGKDNRLEHSFDISGLSESTIYEYAVQVFYKVAVPNGTTSYEVTSTTNLSSQLNNAFVTGTVQVTTPETNTVTTSAASGVTQTGATIGGAVSTSVQFTIISERGIAYGTSPNPTGNKISDSSQSGGFQLLGFTQGPYTLSITGLLANTTYYARAYAVIDSQTNGASTVYGNEISFKTLEAPVLVLPGVETLPAYAIGETSALSGIAVASIGSDNITESGIEWADSLTKFILPSTPNKYTNTTVITAVSTIGAYPMAGLSKNTKYYFRAYAKNQAGTKYGSMLSFTTFDSLAAGQYRLPGDGVDWYQLYKNWKFDETSNISPSLKVDNSARKDILHPISYYFDNTFRSSKNYQFRTTVENFYDIYGTKEYVGKSNGASFSIRTPWGEDFTFPVPYFHLATSPNLPPINLYCYSSLPDKSVSYTFRSSKSYSTQSIAAQNPVTYQANHYFGSSNDTSLFADNQDECITDVKVNEMGWLVQGFSFYTLFNESLELGQYMAGKGWHYKRSDGIFSWLDRHSTTSPITGIRPGVNLPGTITLRENDKNNPVGGAAGSRVSHSAYRSNNYIAKYVSYQNFNISFTYQGGRPDTGVRIYLSPTLPTADATETGIVPKEATLIASLTQSKAPSNGGFSFGAEQFCSFIGLEGNQYFYIVADPVPAAASSTHSVSYIKNIRISGGYHSGNNNKYLINTASGKNFPYFTNATYSTLIGNGNNVNPSDTYTPVPISAKIGNGVFKAGVWENGVWNSGWREDTEIRDFYRVDKFYSSGKDKKWRVHISGPASSMSAFGVGDRVSISNIVAIDINENRKLLKKYFTIVDKTEAYMAVEFENEFPLRRIEIDSVEHRIRVSKNVWLSGTFFNGYFKGIWNYGLFAGYPFLTKMDETHWIDGIFTGGHFTANKMSMTFSSPLKVDHSNSKRLGLTFSSPHGLTTGDIVTVLGSIDLGETVVVDVPDEYSLVTGLAWKKQYENLTGRLYTLISSGLIQNFDFRANNVSKLTSMQSMNSVNVFSYNSWIDVNFSDKSAVNIGKPQFLMDELSGRNYPENNLYGYVTTDILSSRASFRDSFSNTIRNYRLGTKYKIYSDYVGDSSGFDDYFDATDTDSGMETFASLGWEMAKDPSSALTFSRTKEPIDNTPTVGKELRAWAAGVGGVLNLSPAYEVPNRTNGEVEKSRYTMVEFELMTYSVAGDQYTDVANELSEQPPIHFGNLNYSTRKRDGVSKRLAATYLPVYENVNHLTTGDRKKQEFFFNKRNLMMYFRGTGNLGAQPAEYYIDALKLYEVDMVPFFQYFRNNNINKSIQNPYQAIAPVIDYGDTDLNDAQILSDFIENLTDISAPNGMNWVEDIILRRYQDVSTEFDDDTEDVVIEEENLNIPEPNVQTLVITDVKSTSFTVKGKVTAGGNTTIRGFAWGETSQPTPQNNSWQDTVKGEGEFAHTVTGLNPGTTYYVRAYASNALYNDNVYGEAKTAATLNTPVVTTKPASNITNSSVTTGGSVVAYTPLTSWGIIYSEGTDPTLGTQRQFTPAPTQTTGNFTQTLTGLTKGTTYNVWAYVVSNGLRTLGDMKTFATANLSVPTVTTAAITGNTTGTSVTSGGNVASDGGAAVTARGVVWSTSQSPTVSLSTKTGDGQGTGNFTSAITGLTPGKTYYVRAYATNSQGSAYGAEVSFTAVVNLATVVTGVNSTPSWDSVTIDFNQVTNSGGSAITMKGVIVSTGGNDTVFISTGADSSYLVSVTGLAANTTYTYKAFADNQAGRAYGSVKSFATIAKIPTVSISNIYVGGSLQPKMFEGGNAYTLRFQTGGNVTGNINYAQFGGKIESDGGAPIVELGIVWTERQISGPGSLSGTAIADINTTQNYYNKLLDTTIVGNTNTFGNAGYILKKEKSPQYPYQTIILAYDITGTSTDAKDFKMPYHLYEKSTSANISFKNSSLNSPTYNFTMQNPGSREMVTTKSTGFEWIATTTGLVFGKVYSVKMYARNSSGISYSQELVFNTANYIDNLPEPSPTSNNSQV